MKRPLLLIVSGPPGAGKTTIATTLSAMLGLPLLVRDDIKDSLFDSLGWSDREWSKRVGDAAWELMFLVADRLLSRRASLILESNFERSVHARRVADILKAHSARSLEVHCTTDIATLARRFRQRWEEGRRHPGHVAGLVADEERFRTEFEGRDFVPLEIGPVIRVDTSDGSRIDLDAVVRAVRQEY